MKLKSIKLSGMDNGEVLHFFNKIVRMLDEVNTLAFQEIVEKFRIATEKLMDALDINSITSLSEYIKIRRLNINHIFSLMLHTIDSHIHSKNAELRHLGYKAKAIITYFAKIHVRGTGQIEKKDAISNIIDALEDMMTEQERRDIGISTYLKSMKKLNNKLIEMLEQKSLIKSSAETNEIQDIRKVANKIYKELVKVINDLYASHPYDINLSQIILSMEELSQRQECKSHIREEEHIATKTKVGKGPVVA